jgi:hypothetical protein
MIVRTTISRGLLVALACMVGQLSSEAQSPAASLGMTVGFTVRDFQPRIDRTGPMNWIARNPTEASEVFASSISGGLWRSTDGGRNWTPVRILQPWSVSAVAYLFDGTPGGAILVTTREDFRTTSGAGVWRSDNRGESWTQVARVPTAGCSDWPRAHGIAVRGRSVWVATSCGVLQSADGRRFDKIPASTFPPGVFSALSPEIAEHFYSVEVNNSGDVLLGGEAGLFYRFRPATAPAGSRMSGNNAELRRAFATTPSRLRPNFVLAIAGPSPGPPLLISQDSGQTWVPVPSTSPITSGAGGSPFVRIFPASAGSPDLFVYYGDTYALWRAGPFPGGDLSSLADSGRVSWNQIDPIGHPDTHDIDFKSLPGEPLNSRTLLVATDGGLEICNFGTASLALPTCNESQVLGTSSGLSSIQVMSLEGQIIGSGESAARRLYFDTWHTDKWASPDDGANWTRVGGEAAALDMERHISHTSDAQIVYNYNATPNTLSDDLMTHGVNFRDAAGAITPPVILQKGVFVETIANAAGTWLVAAANVTRAAVTRAEWVRVTSLPNCPALPCTPLSITGAAILAGYLEPGKSNAVVYQPHASGLAVVSGIVERSFGVPVLAAGLATVARMKWQRPTDTVNVMQGIAWTPFTGFGQFPVIGADPLVPSHLVIPDMRNRKVMRSLNGGDTWNPIADLSDAVTRDARGTSSFGFNFNRGGFGAQTLVSSISFYPEYPNLVIVGTVENGLFFSSDRAATWQRIPNSEHITNVVALYWRSANSVIVGSFGRGLFEIRMRYTMPRSSMGVICGDCRFLPVGPRLSSIETPRVVSVSLPFPADSKQEDFDEAVLVLDGRINGAEVSQGRLKKLWVTTGSSEYRFSDAKSKSDFLTEERSGFVGFSGLPQAEQLRSQKQVIKGVAFTNGVVTHLIYASNETPTPVPPPLGPVLLPKETNPQFEEPYLRIFGPEVILGTTGMDNPFDLEGYLFSPNAPVELRVDGRATSGQLRTDTNGKFATRLVAPSAIGPHEIVARQLVGNGAAQAAIGFSVNNTDGKRETSIAKKESPGEKKQSPAEKKEPLKPDRKDEKIVVAPALVMLPRLLTADELMLAATASGGKIQLVSLSSAKGPEAKSLDWSGMSSGDELTLRLDLPAKVSVSLYASFLRGPQAGAVAVRVNGQAIGEQLELTSKSEITSKLQLGRVELQPGTNTVTLVVTSPEKGSRTRVSLLALSLEK